MCKYHELLILFSILWTSSAIELNLTESCSGSHIYYCTLFDTALSHQTPLKLLNSSATELQELILFNTIRPGVRLLRVPAELFELAPNLGSLILIDAFIVKIQPKDFQNGQHLRKLFIEKNYLVDIPQKVFVNLPALEELKLSRNSIHLIHWEAFKGLSKLKSLDLESNAIVTLPNGLFNELVNLEYIDLSYNFIEVLDDTVFATNTKLQTVILAENHFAVFQPNTLEHLPRLRLLDISNTIIHELQLQSVDTLIAHYARLERCVINDSLIIMHANNNPLTSLTIGDKSAVHELVLRDNHFKSLGDFVGMNNLQHLDLSGNQIRTIQTSQSPVYIPLPSLTFLSLAFNNLTKVTVESFVKMTRLTHLDLAFNNLIQLDDGIFKPLLNLEKLFIEGNQLQSLNEAQLLVGKQRLRQIGIHGNKWSNETHIRIVQNLLRHDVKVLQRYEYTSELLAEHNDVVHPRVFVNASLENTHEKNPTKWIFSEIIGVIALLLAIVVIVLQVWCIWQNNIYVGAFCCKNFNDESTVGLSSHRPLEEADSAI